MKVGILTFHRAANYGAVLQAYALQRFLNNNGFDAEILDYREEAIAIVHSPLLFLRENFLKNFIRFPIKLHKRIIFNMFINRRLVMSKKRNISKVELKDIANNYDCFIVGSDQVWNDNLTNEDSSFFLDFVSHNKVKSSYAASFGYVKTVKENPKLADYLKDFHYISVREKTGVDILHRIGIEEVEQMADPTLLLSVSEWDQFLIDAEEKDYILVYGLKDMRKLEEIALQIGEREGLKVISINDTLLPSKKIKYIKHPAPETWVSWIKNANLVITNSFHGVVFSLIYKKELIINLADYSDRILNLVNLFHIKFHNIQNTLYRIDTESYLGLNDRIEKERERAFTFLQKLVK